MKTYVKHLFLLPTLIAALGLILLGRASAQTFTTLHSFPALTASATMPPVAVPTAMELIRVPD